MLDTLVGGYGHGHGPGYGHKDHRSNGYGYKDHRSSGYGFEQQKEFVSHEETEEGYFDRQAHYDQRMRLPGNHGRPPMAHMSVCDEEESDVEDYFESSYATVLPHHGKNHHQQPHFMPPPPMALPHLNGKIGNGWQGRHEDAYHGGHGMQHHGGHGMKHGAHGMQHGAHGMQHGAHGMQHHETQHHEMQHHETQHQGGHVMKHHDRLMAPQVPPHHVYMSPNHGSGGGRAVVYKGAENWRASNSTSSHHKAAWGNKGL